MVRFHHHSATDVPYLIVTPRLSFKSIINIFLKKVLVNHFISCFAFFTAFPIISNLDDKIASRLNRNVTVTVDFFSNIHGSVVKLYKDDVNGVKKPRNVYTATENPFEVELPVFSHLIKTKGTKANLTIQIKSEEDLGLYTVVVTNEIGSRNKSFEVVEAGNIIKKF